MSEARAFHRALHDQVDQANDRCFGSQIAQMLNILEVAFILRTQAFDDLAHGAASAAEQLFNAIFDFRSNSDLGHDIFPAGHRQGLARKLIARIGHHHGQVAIGFSNRQYLVLLAGNAQKYRAIQELRPAGRRTYQGQVEQIRLCFGHIFFRYQAQTDQQRNQITTMLFTVSFPPVSDQWFSGDYSRAKSHRQHCLWMSAPLGVSPIDLR